MGLGENPSRRERLLAHRSVGETLLAALIFAIAMGFTWVHHGGDDAVDIATPAQRTATGGDETRAGIRSSLPAGPESSTGAQAPRQARVVRIIDPETGQRVVVSVPSTVVDGEAVPVGGAGTARPPGTATTTPGTATTATTPGGPATTEPPTTQPPTTQPPTTQPPTSAPPTSQPPTTDPPATAPPTSQPYPQGEAVVGAMLGVVAGLVG
jgi:hypothetical protein